MHKHQAVALPKLLISYNTVDTTITDIVLAIESQIRENLSSKFCIITSLNIYNDTTTSVPAALVGVTNVVVINSKGYTDQQSYKREIYLANARKILVMTIELEQVEDVDDFLQNVILHEKATTVTIQYTRNTHNSTIVNAFSLKVLPGAIISPPLRSGTSNYVYISYAAEDSDKEYATILQQAVEKLQASKKAKSGNKEPTVFCMLEDDRASLTTEAAEKMLFNPDVAAIVLLLTPAFLESELCKHETKFAQYTGTTIIPTIWEPIEYPPSELKAQLGSTFTDFSKIALYDTDKINHCVQEVLKLVLNARATVPFGNVTDSNFVVKSVGAWDEADVSNWLRYINLPRYCADFISKHVNGHVLLSLTPEDLKNDFDMRSSHQRVFMSAIVALFGSLNWNNERVLEWIQEIELPDVYDKLIVDSSINGKALLALTDRVLNLDYSIKSSVIRKRFLNELEILKFQNAKVALPEQYRYPLLKDIILPAVTDRYDMFRFHPDMKYLFSDIINKVKDSEFGLLPSGFQKFLFVITVLAYVYRTNCGTSRVFWFDANKVEITAIRHEYLKVFLSDNPSRKYNGKPFLNFEQLYTLMQNLTEDIRVKLTDAFAFPMYMEEEIQKSIAAVCDKEYPGLGDLLSPDQPFFRGMWMQYIFIQQLANELFPLFDRTVNGYLTLGELLAGLDVVIYGNITNRIKLGFCSADLNGDEYLSPDEVIKFYSKIFKMPFRMLKHTGLLPNLQAKKKEKHTVASYVFDVIQEELDPTLPRLLNSDLIMNYFGDSAQSSFPDKLFTPIARAILTPDTKSRDFSKSPALFIRFELRQPVVVTNLQIGKAQNSKCWLSSKELSWPELETTPPVQTKNDFDNFSTVKFESPVKNVRYVYIQIPSKPVLDFFGIWGFKEEKEDYPTQPETKDLYIRAGGTVQADAAASLSSVTSGSVTIVDCTATYFALASEYADSGTTSDNSRKQTIDQQMKELTESLSYVSAKKGSTHINQVQILQDLLPYIHLFLILRGESLQTILEAIV